MNRISQTLDLVIMDPALGICEGHHAGFIEALGQTLPSLPEQKSVIIVCHHDINEQTATKLTQQGFRVAPHFKVDFYHNLNKPYSSSTEKSTFVRELAKQYISIIQNRNSQSLYLYHTMNWDHCQAINLALTYLVERKCSSLGHHVLLLMFHCGINHLGHTTHPLIKMQFKAALKRLAKLKSVSLQTSNAEYLNSYNQLLAPAKDLKLHPNIFAGANDNGKTPKKADRSTDTSPIILYMGDIKAEKGFLNLPNRLKQLLPKVDTSIIIQYSGKLPAAPVFKQCQQELQNMAAQHPKIELIPHFWNQQELHKALAHASLLVMDYDPTVYAEKTSGTLWLSASYRLPIALNGHSWLNREADRLGLCWTTIDDIHKVKSQRHKTAQIPENSYKQELETPFWTWLNNTYHSMTECTSC
ncbi:hypothetical protein [Gynuella sp.]|uniref:hypothetical protein n=1 Tax=Gynuella sp. TaxID=2969146 RepID=UPI003D10C0B8